MNTVRAFLGIPLPFAVRSLLQTLVQSVPRENVHWTKPGNLHVTLVFLGDTELEQLRLLSLALDQFLLPREIELVCYQIAHFPSASSKLVAAYLESNHALTELHRRMTEILDQLAIHFDAKNFKPHITLGRSNKRVSPTVSLATEIRFNVERIELIQSDVTHQGSTYTPLTTIHL